MDKEATEHISTRIISQRELNVDGVPFSWWAVGERPTLVTVRTPIFGALSDFTDGDVAVFAEALAKKLLADHDRVPRRGVRVVSPGSAGLVLS